LEAPFASPDLDHVPFEPGSDLGRAEQFPIRAVVRSPIVPAALRFGAGKRQENGDRSRERNKRISFHERFPWSPKCLSRLFLRSAIPRQSSVRVALRRKDDA